MDLLIVGASARAAAQSARRAGLIPAAIDLFADTDLAAIATTLRLNPDRFPHDLPSAARTFPPSPFLYTGGLENHPRIIAEIARDRPLWGVAPFLLEAVRDPFTVREALRRAGLPTADVRDSARNLPRDGSWLLKPRHSTGGLRIRPLLPDTIAPDDGTHYLQQRIPGRSLGAQFIAFPDSLELLGVVESRQGAPGEPFAYAGGVGPVPLSTPLRDRITAIGRILASTFGLQGLFGIDLIERDGIPIPIEINPRYTASVEILERALGRALLADHRLAFEPCEPPPPPPPPQPTRIVGKAIVYAKAPIRFPNNLRRGNSPHARETGTGSESARCLSPFPDANPHARETGTDSESARCLSPFSRPSRFADIPAPGTPIAPGEPILTVFATGPTPEATHRRLNRLVTRTSRFLHDFGEPFSPRSRTM